MRTLNNLGSNMWLNRIEIQTLGIDIIQKYQLWELGGLYLQMKILIGNNIHDQLKTEFKNANT